MDLAPLTDASNPFNVTGVSDEVRAMFAYLLGARSARGVDVVVTCTTDHPRLSASGNVSRHRQAGTNGEGLAIDCRLRTRGLDIHRAVFDLFVPVEKQLHELIYADAPFNIKGGRRVAPYAVAGHHDHVHVSVDKGRLLRWPGSASTPTPAPVPAPVPAPLPTSEEDPVFIVHRIVPGEPVAVGFLLLGSGKVPIPPGTDVEVLKAAGVKELKLSAALVDLIPAAG